MNIELTIAAYEEKSILRNLLELAQYDYSEYDGYDVDEHGLFGYKYLDHYWTDPERQPYLVRVDGKLAGFVLIRVCDKTEDGTNIYSVAEFCILRKYRGRGVGKEVMKIIFMQFPGKWSIQTCKSNVIAQRFWRSVTLVYEGTEFAQHPDEEFMVIMRFEVKKNLRNSKEFGNGHLI